MRIDVNRIPSVFHPTIWKTGWLHRLIVGERDLMLGKILNADLKTVGYEWHPYKMKEDKDG